MDTTTDKPGKKNGKSKHPNLAAVPDPKPTELNDDTPDPQRKQLEVPGTAPKRNKKVENAALKYRTSFLERVDAARKEEADRGHLRMVMEQEGVKSVRITDGEGDEVVFVLEELEPKIKMKKVSGGDED